MTRWSSIIIAITFTIILVSCTSKEIQPHPTSSPPNETIIAEQTPKPTARISGTETMSTPNFQFTGNNTITEIDPNNDSLSETLVVNAEVQKGDVAIADTPSFRSMGLTQANLTGNVAYSLLDVNADGIAEALVANVEVDILVAGTYFVDGYLMKGGTLVSDGPSWNTMRPNIGMEVSGNPGLHTIQLQFSGEEIFQSGLDGPYELDLTLSSAQTLENQIQSITPAYMSSQFGELIAAIKASADQGEDVDAGGKFDVLRALVTVEVRVPGD